MTESAITTEAIVRTAASLNALAEQGQQELARKLASFTSVVAEEAARTARFRSGLTLALADPKPTVEPVSLEVPPKSAGIARKAAPRRAPALFDPIAVFRADGEAGLRARLTPLDMSQLRDIVAEQALDPTRQTGRMRTAPRLAEYIVERVIARSEKGHAFRE